MALAFKTSWTVQAQWHECDTHLDYLVGLVNWCDSAREPFYADQRIEAVMSTNQQTSTLIRAHRLRVLARRIPYNSKVTVTSWLSRVGTRSYDMSHEVYIAGRTTPIAECTSTIVVVEDGRATGVRNLEDLQRFAFPSGMSVPELTGERPADAYGQTFVVRPSDIDGLNHVHNAKYLHFLENARVDAIRHNGIPRDFAAKFESDTCYVDYIASALEHDTLTMYVWIAQTAPVPALSYQLVREGQTLLRASQTFAIPKEVPNKL